MNNKAKVVIIGTGFGGIAAAVKLKQEGINDIIILERSNDVGGVWRDNHYPGCACDVQSHLFSFSFFPNPNWSRSFSGQAEIHQYLRDCANAFGLFDHIRFHHEVRKMNWIESEGEWEIQTSKGVYRATHVVGAFGVLSDPLIPRIKGIENFKGETFHSATWPKNYSPKGKRIAVVGTGASAIQFIPEIQPEVASLHVFQRTAPWVLPRLDEPISLNTRKWYQRFPLLQKGKRLKIYLQRELLVQGFRNPEKMKNVQETSLKHLHHAIEDPILREKLTPNYTIGCKRILLSNTYYPALAKENVEVNTTGIAEVTEDSVIDNEGKKIEVDTIIFGTGFQVKDLPLAHHIYGREGHSLAQEWNGSPKAYMGTMVAGFPNLFLLQGPNTGLGHSSVIFMIEAQVKQMMKTLKHMRKNKLEIIEPTQKAQEQFVELVEKYMRGSVWTAGGCKSWYLDKAGRNSTLWPGYTFTYRRLASKFIPGDFDGRRVIATVREKDMTYRKIK
ncbi:NAD(P)/FAD-dependent oxidoreductase [Robertmurraya yapensis]|uniref:NAD(P)/FAD-dependent oxidoreductase n=1 Tax=Bacillus yapensis TaxID=2492960 RepID=A0A431WEE6_9BACI|nr:NAD(P)/FAD-dependent oxidoreductase [Bacillus yapensis]RTR33946.1 NAD(P)/FAD-dependent oxidoreductase [Bacillus yapensis]TKS97264.1 NAD(P)/FAD-dependent oxidoreductase [Bacillus yapensis]